MYHLSHRTSFDAHLTQIKTSSHSRMRFEIKILNGSLSLNKTLFFRLLFSTISLAQRQNKRRQQKNAVQQLIRASN